jgi:hypothetical protein
MESLTGWALAGLLPIYTGEDSKNVARSLRRRFAMLGLILGLTLVGTLWEWTANIGVTVGASVVILAGLWLYSEHGHRPAA